MSAAASESGAAVAGRPSRGRSRRSAIVLGLVFAAAAAAALLVSRWAPHQTADQLEAIATLRDFSLTEASGRTVSRADLAGHPWVANLIFTRCAGQCPAITAEMARLVKVSADVPDVRFVSLSCDPENDTPAVLSEYATRHGADRSRWLFLTGEKEPVRKLINEGFRLTASDGDPAAGDDAVIHSPRFVLVDGASRIRGAYDARDSEAMLRLQGDLRALAAEAPGR
jgi:protein SCO1